MQYHPRISNISRYQEGYRYNIQGWVYLYIKGDPRERGEQHGYLLADEIIDLINRWADMIHNHKSLKKINRFLSEEKYQRISEIFWDFCKSQTVEMYSDKYDEYPEFKQELMGIRDGVNKKGRKLFNQPLTYEDVLTNNEMYELMSKLTEHRFIKGFHPLISLYYNLKKGVPEVSQIDMREFVSNFLTGSIHHHCSGFIATGNATTDGQIVITDSMWSTDSAHTWWWSYYLCIRWNIILDINSTNGSRILMSSAPGFTWSDHDYYQNDNGIAFIETTAPQGLWDKKGLPLGIRARLAAQYSNSIDDVVDYLKTRSDGCMNAVWLIGDTKTGEIARLDAGYKQHALYRTFNGFYWSANNPVDLKVRLERFHLREYLRILIINKMILKTEGLGYLSVRYIPESRDLKFEELGEKYYGKIDVDIVKKIMSTEPISTWSSDCKLSDSYLIENHGLWVHIGNPNKMIQLEKPGFGETIFEEMPPVGWTRILGMNEHQEGYQNIANSQVLEEEPDVIWTYENNVTDNSFYSKSIIVDDIIYSTTSTGELLALYVNNGTLLWNITVGKHPTLPTYSEGQLFVGTFDGLKLIDLNWMMVGEKKLGKIVSKPVVTDGKVFVGNIEGEVYCIEVKTGQENWRILLPGEVYISEPIDNYLFVSSGKNCYAINQHDGEIEWVFETEGLILSRPYVSDKTVYFGSWDNHVYAVNATEGDLIWEYETGWGIETTPVVSDGLVLVGSHDQNLYALDQQTGELIWVFSCNAGIHSSPSVIDTMVCFGSDDGRLYLLDKMSGELLWNFSPGKTIEGNINYRTTPIISDPTCGENAVVIGVNGSLYALSV
jgi:outer membrane protein assembly factor BamB